MHKFHSLNHVTSSLVRTTQQISLGILLTVVRPVKYVSRMIFTNLNIIWSPLVNACMTFHFHRHAPVL